MPKVLTVEDPASSVKSL